MVYFRVYAQVIKRDTEILMTIRRDNNLFFIFFIDAQDNKIHDG